MGTVDEMKLCNYLFPLFVYLPSFIIENIVKTKMSQQNFTLLRIQLRKLAIRIETNSEINKEVLSRYLLLAECEVCTASYGPSFFLPFMAQARSARTMKTMKEKTRIHNLPYGPSKRG